MIGAISYRLTAMTSDSIPAYSGTQTHGLCFELLDRTSPALARHIHSDMQSKPFTSSSITVPHGTPEAKGRYRIKKGMHPNWRVPARSSDVLHAFLSVSSGDTVGIGGLTMRVDGAAINPIDEPRTGLIDERDIVEAVRSAPEVKAIKFDFLTVTSFRSDGEDFIAPTPEKIFGSLADKWTAMSMPADIDADEIRGEASAVRLISREGKSRRIRLGKKTIVAGFTGKFAYDISSLDEPTQKKLMMLSQYAELSGTGRLTAQGLGQTKVSCG